MTFRVARHTNDLEKIKSFYVNILGLEVLGGFENHAGYNGIFIGKPKADWHIEFTTSNEKANHVFDDDDILVFYADTKAEYNTWIGNFQNNNIAIIPSKNPYWNDNGKMFLDPDGNRIIISNVKIK